MTRDPTPREEIEFDALRNALYHTSRRLHFEFWNRVMTFVLVLGGTGTILDVINKQSNAQVILGVAITVLGTLQLVVDFPAAARQHHDLQRRYYDILGRIKDKVTLTEEECAAVKGELMRIFGDEPPIYRAADAVAHNEANAIIWGDERRDRCVQVGWWRYRCRHLSHQNRWAPQYVKPKTS